MFFKLNNKSVTLVAADTYRAAAVEQLKIWANRTNINFISNPNTKDPASIAFDGVNSGISNGDDYIIIDTAGRLHTSKNLMKFWTNFAKYGVPGESTNSIKWEPYDINKSRNGKFLIIDEPTEGLDSFGIKTFYDAMNSFSNANATVIVCSHDPNIIKGANWIIDLGQKPNPKVSKLTRTPLEVHN